MSTLTSVIVNGSFSRQCAAVRMTVGNINVPVQMKASRSRVPIRTDETTSLAMYGNVDTASAA